MKTRNNRLISSIIMTTCNSFNIIHLQKKHTDGKLNGFKTRSDAQLFDCQGNAPKHY